MFDADSKLQAVTRVTCSSSVTTEELLEMSRALMHQSPTSNGVLELVVRRPNASQPIREVLAQGNAWMLDSVVGLEGDSWKQRKSSKTPDGSPHPLMQVAIINSRVCAMLAENAGAQKGDLDAWGVAGDQLYVDLDISQEVLLVGTKLCFGNLETGPIIEITDVPHTGCPKFNRRFGKLVLFCCPMLICQCGTRVSENARRFESKASWSLWKGYKGGFVKKWCVYFED